jgi:hypothetical protein
MSIPERTKSGDLPAYAWPGGYPLYYLDKEDAVLCPTCANKEEADNIAAGDVNWEDADLHCDECSQRIPSAYAEDEDDDEPFDEP